MKAFILMCMLGAAAMGDCYFCTEAHADSIVEDQPRAGAVIVGSASPYNATTFQGGE